MKTYTVAWAGEAGEANAIQVLKIWAKQNFFTPITNYLRRTKFQNLKIYLKFEVNTFFFGLNYFFETKMEKSYMFQSNFFF